MRWGLANERRLGWWNVLSHWLSSAKIQIKGLASLFLAELYVVDRRHCKEATANTKDQHQLESIPREVGFPHEPANNMTAANEVDILVNTKH